MTKNKIQLLPEHLIDQIKAGEVIERPASIIKELLENSIDANSTKIDIHICNNGLDLISVTDNGDGISCDDLPYAFCRHATSKITKFDDLYRLHSYGFRGEALASMSAIGRLTCTSATEDDLENAGKIEIHGGEVKHHTPTSLHKSGTAIFIKDLFYKTPARLKFVKSQQSEKQSLKRILNSFILSSPKVTFTVQWDDKEKEIFQATSEHKKRIQDVLLKGKHGQKDLEVVEGEYEGHQIIGFYSHLSSKGNAGKAQYLFANNRIFTDRQIHQTILRSLEVFWGFGQTGHYCFFINVPTDKIDVNVHPNKTQIKFFKINLITSLLNSIIKKHQDSLQLVSHKDESEYRQQEFQHEEKGSLGNFHQQYNQNQGDYQEKSFSFQYSQASSNQYILKDKFLLLTNPADEKLYVFSKLFSKSNPILDQDNTPLIISEPFHYSDKELASCLPAMKAHGFNLEKVDQNLHVLRTVPKSIDKIPPRCALNFLLKYEFSFSDIKEEDIFTKGLATSIINYIQESQELLACGKVIDTNHLKSFFHEY